ncbi:hypothetical protein ACU4HD_46975 [Cupriavidus basilensis]
MLVEGLKRWQVAHAGQLCLGAGIGRHDRPLGGLEVHYGPNLRKVIELCRADSDRAERHLREIDAVALRVQPASAVVAPQEIAVASENA